MDTDTKENLDYLGDRIVQNFMQSFSRMSSSEIAQSLARMGTTGMLPATAGDLAACGTGVPKVGCENLLYSNITTARFYRGGRTNIDQVVTGQIPVAPGANVLLSQAAYP